MKTNRYWIINLKPILILLNFVFTWPSLCIAQASGHFLIGLSKRSIEPNFDQVSVSLAGYGLPAEGRFSLTWRELASRPTFIEVANSKKKRTVDYGRAFKKVEKQGKLIIGIDQDDFLWKGIAHKKNIHWEKLIEFKEIKSLTLKKDVLIALDEKNNLWKIDLSVAPIRKPIQIGRMNGFTFQTEFQSIIADNKGLYALSKEGKWYKAEHQTENSLSTRALIIQKGKDKMVFLTLDLCGFDYSFGQEIKGIISKKHKIDPKSIFINASHTHFAPVSQAWTTWAPYYQEPDSTYLNDVVKINMLKVVDEAFSKKSKGNLFFGRGETNIGINRNKERKGEGPVDKTLDVIKVMDEKQKLAGVIFLTGVHPVFNNKNAEAFTLSANFPGIARQLIEDEMQVDQAMFIQGCAGDINPASDDYRITGKDLATDVIKVLNGTMTPIVGELSSFVDSVLLPVKPMSSAELNTFRIKNLEARTTVQTEKNLRWVSLMEEKHAKGKLTGALPIYFQTMNIGNWKLFGLSREAVTSYGTRIREIWPHHFVSVAGYSNDVSSYLPDGWHIQNKVYEGYESFFWYGQEGIPGLDIQERIIEAIKRKSN